MLPGRGPESSYLEYAHDDCILKRARMERVTASDPHGSRYRDPEYLLGVPRALGPSHGFTQDELFREAARPGRFNRAVDYLRIKWVQWLWHYLKTRIGGRYPFADYDATPTDRGIYPLPGNPVRMAVAGDWGTGTRDAYEVATAMAHTAPHFTIHLGDVYFVGTKKEVYDNVLGGRVTWPVAQIASKWHGRPPTCRGSGRPVRSPWSMRSRERTSSRAGSRASMRWPGGGWRS